MFISGPKVDRDSMCYMFSAGPGSAALGMIIKQVILQLILNLKKKWQGLSSEFCRREAGGNQRYALSSLAGVAA